MDAEIGFVHHIDVEVPPRRWDAAVAGIADRQHGVIARWQLLEIGMGRGAVARRLQARRLHRVHRGVYAVGYRRLSRTGRWMAAVLVGGASTVLSHRAGASLLGLRVQEGPNVEVTVSRWIGRHDRIRAYRSHVPDDERTVLDGIPVTSPSRTLLDLAGVLSRDRLERAIEQAEALRLADHLSLPALLRRYPGRRGAAKLRAILAAEAAATGVTRSELEERFLELVASAGLPRPAVNVWMRVGREWMELDCVWRAEQVVVELDGRVHHEGREAFERDRRRDRLLQAAGWRVVRITWRQLRDEPRAVADDLAALLASTSARRAIP